MTKFTAFETGVMSRSIPCGERITTFSAFCWLKMKVGVKFDGYSATVWVVDHSFVAPKSWSGNCSLWSGLIQIFRIPANDGECWRRQLDQIIPLWVRCCATWRKQGRPWKVENHNAVSLFTVLVVQLCIIPNKYGCLSCSTLKRLKRMRALFALFYESLTVVACIL